ncbi:hypothetical protein LOTGIDRAFT_130809 [Lottia gigantea]|uniref:Ubiquitin carboxyl-terminal hydrolase 48 n=1 Tax=Lottia gigantea TaxID=225164 RepID=V4B8S2_LOTGI|nr:hypothetical protein LOTGIDRAFT_130809 [Lottia gigantea]ESO85194.1 hypothetical protein LOTGIDRAFT_130809 [Lottia gigantea]
MPPKLQLDKEAWKWADTTQPDNVTDDNVATAYRIPVKPCLQGTCKRNCKGNPFCLNGIGEKQWLGELDLRKYTDFDPEVERREKNSYVGLKNLGATCYVNTFLQLWFHNSAVRQAIFKWRDSDSTDVVDENWTPSSICGQLQLIFSLLRYSEKRFIDPTWFINHLGLDTGLQQDAQEFCKLFLNLLESAMCQTVELNIIQEQFRGQYFYVITCKNCGGESKTSSMFYELDLNIQGQKTLQQALDNFLQEEVLEGENRYLCRYCQEKQDATRAIRLDTIPPVLNLQILRFIFDKKTGHKKKLNSFLQFPDTLDMSKYLHTDKPVVYQLQAVLIHSGPSAYSGHYTAHILSDDKTAWYRFNDENIHKMMGKKLQLGTEDEADLLGKEQKIPKTSKGFHSSKNAYMLVYSRQDSEHKDEYNLLPSAVQDYIQKDNEKFNSWISEILNSRDCNIENGKAKQSEIQTIYKSLLINDGRQQIDNMEWINSEWLSKWLSNPNDVLPIDNSILLCPHQKLDPDMICKVKCININGGQQLYNLYNGGPRLKGQEVLCKACVVRRCQVIQLKLKMAADDQKISSLMKNINKSEKLYWIGKSSLRSWKRLALSQLESEERVPNGNSNGTGNGATSPENNDDDVNDQMEPSFSFNTDLLCDNHGNLSCDENTRKMIPEDVWKILYGYFPQSKQYTLDHPVCPQCQAINLEKSEIKLLKKKRIEEQKNELCDLYFDRRRPSLEDQSLSQLYIVSKIFTTEWRKYIKDNGRTLPITCINNQILLCEHNKFLYSAQELYHQSNVVLLYPNEWKILCSYMSCDVDINIIRYKEDSDTNLTTITIPGVCETCQQVRLQAEKDEKYNFRNTVIYVYKEVVTQGQVSVDNLSINTLANGTGTQDKNLNEVDDNNIEPPDKMQKIDPDEISRRKSQRRRKVRGEKEINVSSSMTLKELKIKIMNIFSVPPFDQTLILDGEILNDNTATLQQLKIYPACNILVKVDEPSEDHSVIEDILTGLYIICHTFVINFSLQYRGAQMTQ